MKDILASSFQQAFGDPEGLRFFFAPGRVNLMGDHVDYNGGLTLPCALLMGTFAAVKKNGTDCIRLYSMSYPKEGIFTVPLKEILYRTEQAWSNYPLGVVRMFQIEGVALEEGFDVVFGSTLPSSSGLSSSASIEVVTASFLCALYGVTMSTLKLAKLAQKAENQFIGMNCGILDQLSVAAGKKDYALYLNTATLTYDYAPFQLRDNTLLIVNSNKSRQLSGSKYNERRSECEKALSYLQKGLMKKNLCEYTGDEFGRLMSLIPDEVLVRRARHVVYENLRTRLSFEALTNGNMVEFGTLMTASHLSLKEDYEVSCKETDFLVGESIKQPGVLGARMTGAGFGGCVIVLLEKSVAEEYQQNIKEKYQKEFGLAADIYYASAGDGPCEL